MAYRTSVTTGVDCNANGVPDACETDCNGNDIPDACDLSSGFSSNCNRNSIPDECDIDSGTSLDCNAEGTPDECECDCNGNGVPDDCDITIGTSVDVNLDGVPDDCQMVFPVGSRWIRINPSVDPDLDAATSYKLSVVPDFYGCDTQFIQPDGSLGDEATARTDLPATWGDPTGDVYVGGQMIAPSHSYHVQAWGGGGYAVMNGGQPVTMGIFGDMNHDGYANVTDYLIFRDAFVEMDYGCYDIHHYDLAGCDPNGVLNVSDLSWMDSILSGTPFCYFCSTSCACLCESGVPEPDCNSNAIPDDCDINTGTSQDCNANDIPDECDIAAGTSLDCNTNEIPDECETDCNGNGIPDDCDLTAGTSLDCNSNGIPDECETDCNGNGIPDDCDIDPGTSEDCNGNGVPDECDISDGTSLDCEPDGVPDECYTGVDCNANGVPDVCETDCNGNGIPDDCDLTSGTSQDCNANAIPDECDITTGTSLDCNGNGIPDTCDLTSGTSLDCNANAIPDECDVTAGTSLDCNGNDIPDACDLSSGFSSNCNRNSIPDECDIDSGTSLDCNAEGTPDECECDCNGNGVPDDCDITIGTSVDVNLDGVPDDCQMVFPVGSRWIRINPSVDPDLDATTSYKLRVVPNFAGCGGQYIQPDGSLGDEATARTDLPATWGDPTGDVYVGGQMIAPTKTYFIEAVSASGVVGMNGGQPVTMGIFGDMNHDGYANVTDYLIFRDAFVEMDYGCYDIHHYDLAGCDPNGVLNVSDLSWMDSILSGTPFCYFCSTSCVCP